MDFLNITYQVEEIVAKSGVKEGLCLVKAKNATDGWQGFGGQVGLIPPEISCPTAPQLYEGIRLDPATETVRPVSGRLSLEIG